MQRPAPGRPSTRSSNAAPGQRNRCCPRHRDTFLRRGGTNHDLQLTPRAWPVGGPLRTLRTMTDSTKAAAGPGWLRAGWSRAWRPAARSGQARPGWLPVWSVPAFMRAARATIVMPSLFALTFEVIGNPQMTLFAVFGSFATLVLASFGGTRRDKAIAHLGLA